MSAESQLINAIFTEHLNAANTMKNEAQSALATAYASFANASSFEYQPYDWQTPSAPIIGFNPSFATPSKPALGAAPKEPVMEKYPAQYQPKFDGKPGNIPTAPVLTFPGAPGGEPSDGTGSMPQRHTPSFPSQPALLPLPSATLPYQTISIPNAPVLTNPVFDGVVPQELQWLSLEEYLAALSDSYANYADEIPRLVKSHWFDWYRAMLGENPLIAKIQSVLSSYFDTGGAGIPVPIEEAIVTRATDRVAAEQRRAGAQVFEGAARRGLLLPSGSLLAGMREARQTAAEAVSKVATDTAIKNLELEHDHMKFMLDLGVKLESTLLVFAVDIAKVVTEANGQAIEMTKLVLNGMLEINKANIQIYLAKWEGYKAAVEIYKARWQALEMQVRVYEAEIRAEMAKTEVDKAYVEMLATMVNANKALVEMYKVGVDAETAKLEADRIAIMGYEAAVRAYAAKIEAYKARWQGYAAANEGQMARAKAYEAQVSGYTASVNAYRASIEAESEKVKAIAVNIDAVGRQNEQSLKAWQVQLDGQLRAYSTGIEAFGKEWSAVAEQLRGYASATQIMGDFMARMYSVETQIDIEKAHQHLAEWKAQVESTLAAAKGVTDVANVANSVASSALNGLTAFAGELATATA